MHSVPTSDPRAVNSFLNARAFGRASARRHTARAQFVTDNSRLDEPKLRPPHRPANACTPLHPSPGSPPNAVSALTVLVLIRGVVTKTPKLFVHLRATRVSFARPEGAYNDDPSPGVRPADIRFQHPIRLRSHRSPVWNNESRLRTECTYTAYGGRVGLGERVQLDGLGDDDGQPTIWHN